MEAKASMDKIGIGKVISLFILACLLIWQGFLASFLHDVSELFSDMETQSNMLVFLALAQPILWVFMLLTVMVMFDIYRRNQLFILNTISVVSIVAVANVAFHILTLLAGYGPVFELATPQSK